MTTPLRQSALDTLRADVTAPAYDRSALTPGILHIGVGNFHRAHQAVYLDKLFGMGLDHDWAIIGAGLRPEDARMRENLKAQDWLSSVTEVAADNRQTRVCGAMVDFVEVDAGKLIDALANPEIRIVSLTITEGGYFLEEGGDGFNQHHPDIIHDRQNIENPKTVFGILIAALIKRRHAAARLAPVTILSCDNLPGNGHATRRAVMGLARDVSAELADWIDANVSFPNSMVDRITPATGARERALAKAQLGVEDAAPVVCEPFCQWIVEDRFSRGRPALERVGVKFVDCVAPYELLKLRIVNGSHACIAYLSALLGIEHVHTAMTNTLVCEFLRKIQTNEIMPTIPPVAGVDINDYFESTMQRFANPAIGDTTARLSMDGSNRQPKFIFPAILERLNNAQPIAGLSLEVALWCRYCAATDDTGNPIVIDDINADRLCHHALNAKNTPNVFLEMTDIFGALSESRIFRNHFATMLRSLWKHGTQKTVQNYLN